MASTTTSLEILDDDILLEIIAVLKQDGEAIRKDYRTIGRRPPNLRNLSMTSRRLRQLTAPTIFRQLKIRGDWKKAATGLKVVRQSPLITESIKALSLCIYNSSNVQEMPYDLPSKIISILPHIPKLVSLDLALPNAIAPLIEAERESQNFSLPTVRVLKIERHFGFFLKHTPAIESFCFNGSWPSSTPRDHITPIVSGTLQLAGPMEKLTFLELGTFWNVDTAKDVVKFLPNIQTLHISGVFDGERPPYILFPTLIHLQRLTTLALPRVGALNVGLREPRFSGAYEGPGGDAYMEQVAAERQRLSDEVARNTFVALPQLQTVWVDSGCRYEVKRNDDPQNLEVTLHRGDLIWNHYLLSI